MYRCAGVLFISKQTKRGLFALRGRNSTFPFTWDLFGGKIKNTELILDGLERELGEEMGFDEIWIDKLVPIHISQNQKYTYYSFVALVDSEFIPHINREHEGYCWINIDDWKSIRLHPKVKEYMSNPSMISNIKKLLRIKKL